LCLSSHETDDTPENQQKGANEQTELDGVLANETVYDTLRALDDLFDAEEGTETAFDQIAKKTGLGGGGETRADAGTSVFAVDGPLELKSENFSEISLNILKISKRQWSSCWPLYYLLIRLYLRKKSYLYIRNLF
jgi:hypothetical protein